MLAFAFEKLGKHRVIASADPCNATSLRLLERVGMRNEAHLGESLRVDRAWVDDVIYAMLDREWRGSTASGRHRR